MKARFVIYGILMPFLVIVGALGDVFTVVLVVSIYFTLKRSANQKKNSATCMYVYIGALSLADLGYLSCAAQNSYFRARSDEMDLQTKKYVYQFLVPTWNIFKCLSDYIVILMTLNRFQIIAKIARFARREINDVLQSSGTRSAKIVISQLLIAAVASIVLYLPYYINVDVTTDEIYGCKPTVGSVKGLDRHCNETSLGRNECCFYEPLWIFFLVINAVFSKTLPVIIVSSLNVYTAYYLWQISKRRMRVRQRTCDSECVASDCSEPSNQGRGSKVKSESASAVDEVTMARLMIVVAILFLGCNIPANATYMRFMFDPNFRGNQDFASNLITVTNFFECINYSMNFYIYCAVNGDIRRTVKSILNSIFKTCFPSRKATERVSGDIE